MSPKSAQPQAFHKLTPVQINILRILRRYQIGVTGRKHDHSANRSLANHSRQIGIQQTEEKDVGPRNRIPEGPTHQTSSGRDKAIRLCWNGVPTQVICAELGKDGRRNLAEFDQIGDLLNWGYATTTALEPWELLDALEFDNLDKSIAIEIDTPQNNRVLLTIGKQTVRGIFRKSGKISNRGQMRVIQIGSSDDRKWSAYLKPKGCAYQFYRLTAAGLHQLSIESNDKEEPPTILRRRGRPPSTNQFDCEKLHEEWEIAKMNGTTRKDFAKHKGIAHPELCRLLNREQKRRSRMKQCPASNGG